MLPYVMHVSFLLHAHACAVDDYYDRPHGETPSHYFTAKGLLLTELQRLQAPSSFLAGTWKVAFRRGAVSSSVELAARSRQGGPISRSPGARLVSSVSKFDFDKQNLIFVTVRVRVQHVTAGVWQGENERAIRGRKEHRDQPTTVIN